MAALSFVGLSGNITEPSRTRTLVETALDLVRDRIAAQTSVVAIPDFGDDLGRARRLADLGARGQELVAQILAADALVVATPIYKASYPGLFKHLIDLLDPSALLNRPILIAATGGGERHALAVEHQLRPLFAFFEARVLPTAVHVSDKDFEGGVLTAPPVRARLARAVAQFEDVFPAHARPPVAAAGGR